MKVIIAGSRSVMDSVLMDASVIKNAVEASGFTVDEVVSGGARGVDRLGEEWAHQAGVPVRLFLPSWSTIGRGAGFARNVQMADYADALVAVWDGKSPGTKHMIETMRARGKPVYVVTCESEPNPL